MTRAAPAGPPTVRRHNRALVLAALRAAGSASRAQLAAATGLTRATVAALLEPLLDAGVLAEAAAAPRGVGRPSRAVGFHPDGPVALGVAVDVDTLTLCAVGVDGTVRAHRRVVRDHRRRPPAAVLGGAAAHVTRMRADVGAKVLGVGLALPAMLGPDPAAPVDAPARIVLRAPNLPRLVGSRPDTVLAGLLGPPVTVENEATLGALAHLDLAPDLVYVSAGIGIGGGIVLDGRVYRGHHGLAGEIGHVVVERDGPECGCGGRGCVEQYAGSAALSAAAGVDDLPALEARLARGDPRARAATTDAARALGTGLASVLNVLDVPVVVLGGTFARLAPHVLPALRAELADRVLAPTPVRVLTSGHGDAAVVLGAAESVLDAVARDPDRLLTRPPAR